MPRQRRRRGRPIDGILILDKPQGITSNGALQRVKRLFDAQKAGHTGSLDPLATGVLPICFGKSTKLSQKFLDADKRYEVQARLGIQTDTSDSEGEVVKIREVPLLTQEAIDQACDSFRGEITQIPSMYSALKHQGKPLYAWAREGVTIEREPRALTIHELNVVNYKAPIIYFNVYCTKGTYIRTLTDDLGEKLGCGAHVTALRRTQAGPFTENQMVTLEQLEALSQGDLDTLLLTELGDY